LLEHMSRQEGYRVIPMFCGGDGDSPGSDPDNSGDNEPPDSDDYGSESSP